MNHLDDTKGGFLTKATTQHAMAIILGGLFILRGRKKDGYLNTTHVTTAIGRFT